VLAVFARPKRRLAPAPGPAIRAVRDGFATPDIAVPWDGVSAAQRPRLKARSLC
jgi:hypothetical protein